MALNNFGETIINAKIYCVIIIICV